MRLKRIMKAAIILGALGLFVLGMTGRVAKADSAPFATATPTPMGGEYPYVEVEEPVHELTAEERQQLELRNYLGLIDDGKVIGAAGVWYENGDMDVIHIGVTKAADYKAIAKKLEKLGAKEVRMYMMKYTLRELRDLQNEIYNTYWQDEAWTRSGNGQWTFSEMGVDVKSNVLCIGLYVKAAEADKERIKKRLYTAYGDKVKIFDSYGVVDFTLDTGVDSVSINNAVSEPIQEAVGTEEPVEVNLKPFMVYRFDGGFNVVPIVAAILAVVIVVAAYAFRRRTMRMREIAVGSVVAGELSEGA